MREERGKKREERRERGGLRCGVLSCAVFVLSCAVDNISAVRSL